MKTILVNQNDSNQRLDKFLTKTYPNLPQSMLYKCIRKKDIKINGKRCSDISARLQVGDVLTLYLKDDFLQKNELEYDFLKAPKTLDIVYEDSELMILDKKPGLLVHPDENYHFDSLVARIKHYLFVAGSYNPRDEHSFTPALLNRIDRNTGGLVMAAKNAESLRKMNSVVHNRGLHKYYVCIVCGILKQKSGHLVHYLEKNESQNRVYISNKKTKSNKTIETKYRVIEERGDFSLVHVELLTGRTHQIRAHFAYIGHPLLGDGKYGINEINKKMGFSRQALYSFQITFDFQEDMGYLEYLNHESFTAKEAWFIENFNRFPE